MSDFDLGDELSFEFGMLVLSGYQEDAAGATNRLLLENGDSLQLEDGSGSLELES